MHARSAFLTPLFAAARRRAGLLAIFAALSVALACTGTDPSDGPLNGDGDGDGPPRDGGTTDPDAGEPDGGVVAPTITALSVTPDPALVAAGTSFAFTAIATLEGGGTQDITALASWTSSNAAVATVGNELPGVAVVIAADGTCDIVATYQDISASAQLKVVDAVLTGLLADPATLDIAAGVSAPLSVSAVFSDGSETDVTAEAVFTSANPSVVSTNGAMAQGVSEGFANILATYAGQSASIGVTVSAAEVQSVTLNPQNPQRALGQKIDFTVSATLSEGSIIDVTALASFTVAAGLDDEGAGRVRASTEGTFGVSATYAGQSASTNVTVGPLRIVDLSTRDKHSLAVLSDGRVQAWGRNDLGQTTKVTTMDHVDRVFMSGLPRIVAASAGGSFSAMLDEDGQVWSVGGNEFGERGDGTTDTDVHIDPYPVDGLDDVIALDAGVSFGLAQRADGHLLCWGMAYSGQCGRDVSNLSTPLEVPDVGPVSAFSAGSYHSAVVDGSNTLYTMGWNLWGQTGQGTSGDDTDIRVPTAVDHFAAEQAVEVHTGWGHTVFRATSGDVYGFGLSSAGQLGVDPVMFPERTTPVFIAGNVTQLASAFMAIFMQTGDGRVYALGENFYGTLGQGDTMNSIVPVQVKGVGNVGTLTNIVSVNGGGDHVIARNTIGAVFVWGSNQHGELGTGTLGTNQLTPVLLNLP